MNNNNIPNQLVTYPEQTNYLNQQFAPAYGFPESGNSPIVQTYDLFSRQFPLGMPFGLKKPSLASIQSSQGTQYSSFAETSDIGVVRNNVYPNFSANQFFIDFCHKPLFSQFPNFWQTLVDICQTDSEKNFLLFYINNYLVHNANLPILIPQAWIQWHAKNKSELHNK